MRLERRFTHEGQDAYASLGFRRATSEIRGGLTAALLSLLNRISPFPETLLRNILFVSDPIRTDAIMFGRTIQAPTEQWMFTISHLRSAAENAYYFRRSRYPPAYRPFSKALSKNDHLRKERLPFYFSRSFCKEPKECLLMADIGHNIRKFRRQKGLTQEELAERIEASRNYVCQIETNRKIPSFKMMIKIADALDSDPSKLAENSSEEKEDHTDVSIEYLESEINRLKRMLKNLKERDNL